MRPDSFAALVCSGADGSGGIVRNARAIAATDIDLDLVVICGRNERARSALSGLRTSGGTQGVGKATTVAVVAGSVGPTGDLLAPLGPLTEAEAQAVFAEQIAGLREGGADMAARLKAAAKVAAEATIPMRAIRGRASFLGERSIGHMDPGARSSALIVDAVAEVMEGLA